jgi:uncharacterized HAD superfamily protein
MRIGLDFDDVVADSMQAIIDLHNREYGTSFKKEDASTLPLADREKWGGTKEEWSAKMDDFLSTDHLADLNPVAGVIPAIEELKKHHELYIVTGREDTVATEQWIVMHFPETFKGVHYANHLSSDPSTHIKKSVICKEHGIELYIEDVVANAKDCAEAGIKVFLFDQPWNQGALPPNVERVKSWEEIVRKLRSDRK